MTEIKRDNATGYIPFIDVRPRLHRSTLTSRSQMPTITPPLRPYYRPVETVTGEAVGALPNTLIIGAMKCGTTSLHEYLSYHPEVSMSTNKETNFFVKEQNWSKGLGWYRQNFRPGAKVIGESSPNYARYPLYPGVPERMRMIVPGAKLILCVRDPIKRMLSHYVHSYSVGRENRYLDEAFRDERYNPYLLCSRYHYQLEQYLPYFAASQIHIVVLEDLEARPQETLRSVFEFLEVDSSYTDERFNRASRTMPQAVTRRRSPLKSFMAQRRMRGYYWLERNLPWVFGRPIPRPELTPELHAHLAEKLAPDVAALRAFSGYELTAWKV